MKSYSQFIDEALLPYLIKAAARSAFRNKGLISKVASLEAKPIAKTASKIISKPAKITGFRTGGGNRGTNFDPMKGSKYTLDPKTQTTQSFTAPGHTKTPAGPKPRSDTTRFGSSKEIQTALNNKDIPSLRNNPKIGDRPLELWRKYPDGVEYTHGKFSKDVGGVKHVGSAIVDIQTKKGGSNLPLFGAQRKELKDRVKTGLQRPANIQALKKELGIKEDLIQEGRKKELRRAFDQGLRDGRPEIVTKAPPESSAPTAPGSPERMAQIKREILGQSGGGKVEKAQKDKNKAFKKRRKEAIERIANKSKPKLNVTKVDAKKTFREFLEEAKRMRVLRTAHYTSRSNKSEIMRGGFKDSPSTGSYHPDNRKDIVYTTPSSRVGTDYGYSRVNLRLVNPKVTSTDSPRDFGKNIKSWMASSSIDDINDKKGKPISSVDQAKVAFQKGDKVVRVPNAHGGFTPREGQVQGSYIMMDKDTANKSIDRNPQPTMRAKGKERRTKTQPKKDT